VIPLLTAFLAVNIGPVTADAPAREPRMAVHGANVALAFGEGNAIYFAISHNSGESFSAPEKIAEAAVIPLTRHRGPHIVFAGDAVVITAVAGKTAAAGPHAHGLPSDGDLIAWRSTNEGKTWSKGIVVNDVPGSPTEGLHALASGANGRLFAAWLDHRGGHGTKLYGAESRDGGESWSKNVLIYASPEGTICECCSPSAVIDAHGEIHVMWRNWLDGSRDMYLARSRDGVHFSKPEKLGDGTWKLNACPMDGGGIAVDNGAIVTVWRRDHGVYLDTAGKTETRIGTGTDPAISAGASGVFAIWTTSSGLLAKVPGKADPVEMGAKGSFPDIVALPGAGALAAWEDNGRIEIRRVP
jgi:hypothetical protein